MANRKAALRRAPHHPNLRALPDRAGPDTLTEEQLRQQKASFAYGNTPEGSRITRVSAGESVDRTHLVALTAFNGPDPGAGR